VVKHAPFLPWLIKHAPLLYASVTGGLPSARNATVRVRVRARANPSG